MKLKRKLMLILMALSLLGTLPLFARCGMGVGTPEAGEASGAKV